MSTKMSLMKIDNIFKFFYNLKILQVEQNLLASLYNFSKFSN